MLSFIIKYTFLRLKFAPKPFFIYFVKREGKHYASKMMVETNCARKITSGFQNIICRGASASFFYGLEMQQIGPSKPRWTALRPTLGLAARGAASPSTPRPRSCKKKHSSQILHDFLNAFKIFWKLHLMKKKQYFMISRDATNRKSSNSGKDVD